jgi:uncharacterized repeat protein (TIGR03837 family)
MGIANRWDIFCRVIDNFGDIGVGWRLAADLASRGHTVRLWVDDPAPLTWMAPGALQGHWGRVTVLDWGLASDAATLEALPPAQVWIEAFGCDIPPAFLAHQLQARAPDTPPPAWINLEYLSAEGFAQRAHGLPSPVMHGAAKGCTKHFFYPGFTPASGGLLREPDLDARQDTFDRARWLVEKGIRWNGEQLVSLFCYEPEALATLVTHWQQQPDATRLLVTHGRAAAAVRALPALVAGHGSVTERSSRLSIDFLDPMTQRDYDHLLWTCDLNLVRGEDSVVRALWAGKPFVWQIYPQHDDAHHAKLDALLDALDAPATLRQSHQVWNAIQPPPMPRPDLAEWAPWAQGARRRLRSQSDLVTRLIDFVGAIAARAGYPSENR